jgi:hypothetical protein
MYVTWQESDEDDNEQEEDGLNFALGSVEENVTVPVGELPATVAIQADDDPKVTFEGEQNTATPGGCSFGTSSEKFPELGKLLLSPEYCAVIVTGDILELGVNTTEQEPDETVQVSGENVPGSFPSHETVPVGSTPSMSAVHVVEEPFATVGGEQETSVVEVGTDTKNSVAWVIETTLKLNTFV